MSHLELLEQGLWGFIATAGFGVLFNVPTAMLPVSGFTGAMGHMWRRALLANGVHPVVATFVGAFIVGMLGYSQARFFHMPRLIFTVTGIISMVPGVTAFETVVYFLRNDFQAGIENGPGNNRACRR
ncbi:MAG TPA: threonine/serine exporter family protein, partial [Aggregatilineaceae bacterium]|nr:threonine/serine exporter family protein [Aggregatilineaceae bacterium]